MVMLSPEMKLTILFKRKWKPVKLLTHINWCFHFYSIFAFIELGLSVHCLSNCSVRSRFQIETMQTREMYVEI